MSDNGIHPDAGKRQKILESAFAVFSQKGYQQTKVEEVAQHAGIGKGTVYLYFTSKEELLREMLKAMIKKYLSELKQKLAEETDPWAKLKVMYTIHVSLLQENPSLVQLHLHDFAFVNDQFRSWLETEKKDFVNHIAAIIESGIQTGQFRPLNAKLAAALIISSLGVFLPPHSSECFSVDELVDLLFHGMSRRVSAQA
ncbi:hypothetical protein GCM10010965_08940 [Caldalkalibacillus thermarum]|uniref:TetR/AcrR family transcriptional regulator n=1 Tax=Caldalkalibacillus thermarum TaxID=296745 RepID=UPI0016662A5A|nr:TetR/AcrR family transcriptional regulator [Caldalkalibacillus thermarum]GGK18096.1 hypothetical protein GCM10010965_08940 [Caldalkalibacillus thermarum]